MIDDINRALADYITKWDAFVAARTDKAFFKSFKPTAVGWKVEDLVDFNAKFDQLRDQCDSVVLKWMNDRWIAKMHLKEESVGERMSIIKIMQRRPGSSDAIGLDHVDFYNPDTSRVIEVLKEEADVKWTREENGKPQWISVWFAGTEAKLKNYTVLDVTMNDLKELKQKVLGA